MNALPRYTSERCRDCGRGLNWIEIAFGRSSDPVCGRCLMNREDSETDWWKEWIDHGGEG